MAKADRAARRADRDARKQSKRADQQARRNDKLARQGQRQENSRRAQRTAKVEARQAARAAKVASRQAAKTERTKARADARVQVAEATGQAPGAEWVEFAGEGLEAVGTVVSSFVGGTGDVLSETIGDFADELKGEADGVSDPTLDQANKELAASSSSGGGTGIVLGLGALALLGLAYVAAR